MNLDPITIILFLLFFVAPLVNNFLRRGQGGSQNGPGRGQRRPRQPQTAQRPNQRAQGSRDADNTTADTADTGGSAGDEFSRRLEEARRRVQEAMSGEQERRPTQTSTPSASQGGGDETKRDLFPRLEDEKQARSQQGRPQQGQDRKQGSGQPSGQGQARRPFEGLGREGASVQGRRSQQGMATQQGSADRTDLGDAPPLRVQRLRPRKRGKIDEPRGVLEFDRRSVLQGIIWREILDEPLSKRRRRKRL